MLCMIATTQSDMGVKSLYPGAIVLPVFSIYIHIYALQSQGANHCDFIVIESGKFRIKFLESNKNLYLTGLLRESRNFKSL